MCPPCVKTDKFDYNQYNPGMLVFTQNYYLSLTAKFACIKAYFTLKRDIGYYIIQVYVPSILIVALSWVSFWLDLEAIPARVSLGVLTVLTLNTHGSHIQSQLPKVIIAVTHL